MALFSAAAFFGVSLVYGCWTASSSKAFLSMELQKSEKQLDAKVNQLEERNSQLQIKNVQIEGKVTQLEAMLQQPESIMTDLLHQKNGLAANSKYFDSNRAIINGTSKLCSSNVRMIGHNANGLYSRMEMRDSAYCDSGVFGFPKQIKHNDIKSVPINLHAQRKGSSSIAFTSFPFDLAVLHQSPTIDVRRSGAPPLEGNCIFPFTGLVHFPSATAMDEGEPLPG